MCGREPRLASVDFFTQLVIYDIRQQRGKYIEASDFELPVHLAALTLEAGGWRVINLGKSRPFFALAETGLIKEVVALIVKFISER